MCRTIAVDGAMTLEREMLAALPLARTDLGVRTLLAQRRHGAEAMSTLYAAAIGRILADRSLDHLLHPPRVAIVGAPNVGKSTLANQLFAQERSITADLPGTTRDWVGEIANIDGLAVTLVDTPGVRDTADAIEREAIDRSGERSPPRIWSCSCSTPRARSGRAIAAARAVWLDRASVIVLNKV